MITVECQPEQDQGDSPIQTSARRTASMISGAGLGSTQPVRRRSWLTVRWCKHSRSALTGKAEWRRMTLRRNRNSPTIIIRNGTCGDMSHNCTGSTGPGDAAEAAAQEQHGHRDHPQPEHQIGRQPNGASPADTAKCEPRSACDRQPSHPAGQESCRRDDPAAATAKLPRAARPLANAACP